MHSVTLMIVSPPLLDRADQPLRAAELLADELLGLGVLQHPLGEVLVDVEALQALVVVADDELRRRP